VIELVEYSDSYADDFRRINLEWLDENGLTEALDRKILDDPKGTILSSGGKIFFAKSNNEIIGSAALINENNGIYELVKMTVIPSWQGKGVGNLLMERCLAMAKELKAKRIVLFSNSKLKQAISLYSKHGFKHIPVTDSPFETANVKMELNLKK
jgi:putative acetyltransferase